MSKTIAHLATQATRQDPSDVLDFTAKFFRVMGNAGAPLDRFKLPVQNRTARRNLADFLNAGCPKLPIVGDQTILAALSGYELVRLILGNDFIPPEEIALARPGIVYDDGQLDEFAATLPSIEKLAWCRANDCMVVATPPQPMSCLAIRDLKPEYFYTKTGGWYANEKERFSRDMKTGSGWLMLRKGAVPNSFSERTEDQLKLLSPVEYVPNDAEVEWGVTTYKAVRGIFLLPDFYVRTSSFDSGGNRVNVGDSGNGGLDVGLWNDKPRSNVGLASARKS